MFPALLHNHRNAPQADGIVPVKYMLCNEEGIVVEIAGEAETVNRLASLGLSVGTAVKVICQGRTRLLRAGRTRLSLRGDDLEAILVERLPFNSKS